MSMTTRSGDLRVNSLTFTPPATPTVISALPDAGITLRAVTTPSAAGRADASRVLGPTAMTAAMRTAWTDFI